ncbi:MAG: helix-turn-helix domain-containing protein [Firmicutes bacterium]|nr:helix-turn-helix domain-containing protein [Bacillota bacterium]
MSHKHAKRFQEIGRRIAFYRKRRGLTQQELADRVGISKSYLSKIEAPATDMTFSLAVLFDIANELEVEVEMMFRREWEGE